MLFRTVYGPELEAIYVYIAQAGQSGNPVPRQEVLAAFVPRDPGGGFRSTQNLDDALSFLRSAKLIQGEGAYQAAERTEETFRTKLFCTLRRLELKQETSSPSLDCLYWSILTNLFIQPNCLFVQDVYGTVNSLREVSDLGGISREKVQAWKRVLEYLGLGRRAFGGFLCVYSPEIIWEILRHWAVAQATLQEFFEEYFGLMLPYARQDGDLADAVRLPLIDLADRGFIELFPLQDSPTRPYFGSNRWRGIIVKEDHI